MKECGEMDLCMGLGFILTTMDPSTRGHLLMVEKMGKVNIFQKREKYLRACGVMESGKEKDAFSQ